MKEMNIEQVDGTQLSANGQLPKFINAFTVPELNKNYIMYTCDEFVYPNSENVNEMNIKKVYVSEIVNEANGISLVGITDDNEWKLVVASMIKVKSGEIKGIRINVSTPMKLKGKRHIGLKNDNIDALSAVAITEEPVVEAAPAEEIPAPAPKPEVTPVVENSVSPAPAAPVQTPIAETPVVEAEPQVIVSESNIIEEPVVAPKPEVVAANTVNNIDDTNVFNNATGPVVDALREGQVTPGAIFETPQKVEITETVAPVVETPSVEPVAQVAQSTEAVVAPEIPESEMPTFNDPNTYVAPAVEAPAMANEAPSEIPAPAAEVNYFDSPAVETPKEEVSLSFPTFESAPVAEPAKEEKKEGLTYSLLDDPRVRAQLEEVVKQMVREEVERLNEEGRKMVA